MIILLSPAKSLNMQRRLALNTQTEPAFLSHTDRLVATLKQKSVQDLKQLMGLSDKLAELNWQRFQSFSSSPDRGQTAPAFAAFDGDVYTGLNAERLSAEDLDFAQQHVRILSGLYGLLRPLDAIQPYRLEMGTKLATGAGEDLYDFWGLQLAEAVNKAAEETDSAFVVNLASNEYFKAAAAKHLQPPVITPIFKERRDGQLKQISFYAKKARGTMTRWMVCHRVMTLEILETFAEDGYSFDSKNEANGEWLFVRG